MGVVDFMIPSTTPPPPPHRRRDRCPCGECCVRRELSSPGEVGFPAKAALAVGLVVGGLRGGEATGLPYRYRGTRCWRPEVKDWAYPAGGVLDGGEGTARRGRWRGRRWGRGVSCDLLAGVRNGV